MDFREKNRKSGKKPEISGSGFGPGQFVGTTLADLDIDFGVNSFKNGCFRWISGKNRNSGNFRIRIRFRIQWKMSALTVRFTQILNFENPLRFGWATAIFVFNQSEAWFGHMTLILDSDWSLKILTLFRLWPLKTGCQLFFDQTWSAGTSPHTYWPVTLDWVELQRWLIPF